MQNEFTSIRAGAGSGKTKEIVRNYLLKLSELIDDPESILSLVAITFTRNAANELKEKIRKALIEEIQNSQSELKKRRLRKLIFELPLASISTIDSFASSILRANAIIARLPQQFDLFDESAFINAFKKFFNSTLLNLLPTDSELENLLLAFGWQNLCDIICNLRLNSAIVEPLLENFLDSTDGIKRAIARLYFAVKENENPPLVGFSDILNECRKILNSDSPRLKRTSFIFVDEFQDTDSIQWGIIKKVVEHTGCGLMIVGDEKQSIYGFRGADYTVFDKAEKELGCVVHDKRENWRSLANPLKFVNRIFAYKNLGGREYEPLSLARNSSLNGKVELIVIESDFSWNAEYHRKIIGKAISNRIYYGLFGTDPYKRFNVEKNGNSARAKPGDVAVLVRDRKFLPWITYFLKRNNVPFIVFKGSGFLETEEIRDALAVISFLKNPADDLSLIAILRSPIFGFSDDLILKISVLSGKTFYEKMKNAFRAEKLFTNTEFEMIRRFIEIVEPLFPLYQAEKPSNAIMKFLEKSWAWMLYAALPDGAQRIENLKKFILYLLEYEKRSFSGDVIEWMVSLKENESEAPVELEGDDAVKILTIHAAKGLEFPVVVLPLWKFERKGGKSSDLIIDRANIALKYFDPLKGEIEDEEFKIMREKEKERLKEEEERLLYVALTRAKDHLSLIFDENFVSENKPEKLPELYKNMKSLLKNDSEVNIDCYQIPIDELEKKEIIAYEASIEKFISIGNFDDFMLTKAKPMVKAAESYIEISATELAEAIYKKDEFKETDERVREYASDFGSLVHDIIIFEPERIDNFIEDFVKRFEFCKPEDIRTQINNIIEKFRNSELYNFMRGKQNLTILREFPFSLRRKNLIINGRIDLLVLSGKEAYIIDIKSDRIEDNMDEKVLRYAPQLWIYGLAFMTESGIVPDLYLYFARLGSWIKLPEVDIPSSVDELIDRYNESRNL